MLSTLQSKIEVELELERSDELRGSKYMRLVAVIPKEDLVALIEDLTPMRIVIDERRGRNIMVNRPSSIELVPERGLRLRGDARITWDVGGMPLNVTVNEWQVLLVPRIVQRERDASRVLALEPIVEQVDLKRVPGFIDDRIASALREGLDAHREKLAWNFARTLTKRLTLPLRMGPARHFEIIALDGGISVSQTELRLAIGFEARVSKEAAKAIEASPEVQASTAPASVRLPESRRSRVGGPPSSRRPERRATAPRMR